MTRTAVHLSPHPDDETLGAPATLLQLLDADWQVVNVVATLGRELTQHARRRAEAEHAAAIAGWELRVVASVGDLATLRPDVWISPSPHDGHPTHERVARELRDLIERSGAPSRWWMWGGWADLPMPTMYVPFGESLLERALHVLDAYAGELARNDYRRLLRARATANAVLGSERVFGFGAAAASPASYAELLTEVVFDGSTWALGPPRIWSADAELVDPTAEDIGWWLHAPSVREARVRASGPVGTPPEGG
jgi:LmbE family N-acetylglucosaminyl deacetylase